MISLIISFALLIASCVGIYYFISAFKNFKKEKEITSTFIENTETGLFVFTLTTGFGIINGGSIILFALFLFSLIIFRFMKEKIA